MNGIPASKDEVRIAKLEAEQRLQKETELIKDRFNEDILYLREIAARQVESTMALKHSTERLTMAVDALQVNHGEVLEKIGTLKGKMIAVIAGVSAGVSGAVAVIVKLVAG